MKNIEKIEMTKRKNIILPPELASDKNIVGVYKIFAIKDEISTCHNR